MLDRNNLDTDLKPRIFIVLCHPLFKMKTIDNQIATIYVVDDEFYIRDSLQLLLDSFGYKASCFESAEAFLENFQLDGPACLILDVLMYSIDGIELQQILLKKGIDIPIIFISGHGDVTTSSKAFRAGAVDFFEKPFDHQALLKRIGEALEDQRKNWEKLNHKRKVLSRYHTLTPREKEVLKLIMNGTNKESAKVLGISHRTIDAHRAHIMEKMQAESLSELIMMAIICDQL